MPPKFRNAALKFLEHYQEYQKTAAEAPTDQYTGYQEQRVMEDLYEMIKAVVDEKLSHR